MFSMLTVVTGLVVVIAAAGHEEWGTVAVTVAAVLILLVIRYAARKDAKAKANWLDYWAEGREPDWQRQRRIASKRDELQARKKEKQKREKVERKWRKDYARIRKEMVDKYGE